MRTVLIVIMSLLVVMGSVVAQEAKDTKGKTKPVQDAPKVEKGYVPKPEITIIEGENRLVKEYRINGQVRAIKVTPTNGFPPYYLIDRAGNGEFQKLGPDMGEDVIVPNWIIIEW